MGETTNWAQSVTFAAEVLLRPTSVDELRGLVAKARKVRALGSAHSFNDIADTPEALVSVDGLPDTFEIDGGAATARVSAGVRYSELGPRLHERGYALANLASLPHVSVAGAIATGSHGSGDALGTLSTAVSAIEMVTADGDLVELTREDDGFDGAVVSLGTLGVLTTVTLDLLPTFDVRQYVFYELPFDVIDRHFDDLFSAAYSVGLFTLWREPAFEMVWIKRRDDQADAAPAGESWFTARPAEEGMHSDGGTPFTEQLGVPGPWHERLPHFQPESTHSTGVELQTEFLLPRRRVVEALHTIWAVRDRVAPVVQVTEIRTVAADELWLSPTYGRDTACVHFTWIKDMDAVLPVIALLEELLAPYDARPHWGKLFTVSPADRYPRMRDFHSLMRRYDPGGKFTNDYIERFVEGVAR